jgi:cytochrome c biogenesis protein CcmG/thiol:disulfide interchange protein DsbE
MVLHVRSGLRVVALVGALAIAGLSSDTSKGLIPAQSRKSAPDFALQDSAGTVVKLSDYKGKVVLLDFWATWCHGCKTEIPWYVEFQDRYKADGLSAIGVSMDDSWDPVRSFLAEHKVNYPIVLTNDEVTKLYKIGEMPVTLLIDRDGKVADWHVGMVDKGIFEQEIQQLLKDTVTQHSSRSSERVANGY